MSSKFLVLNKLTVSPGSFCHGAIAASWAARRSQILAQAAVIPVGKLYIAVRASLQACPAGKKKPRDDGPGL
jgi:hypothetical protein